MQPGFPSVPQDVISEFMDPSILISNPLLDYAYSKQDVENMVIATTRSHKDSETFASAEESLTLRLPGDIPNSTDRNLSPTESVGSPLMIWLVCWESSVLTKTALH